MELQYTFTEHEMRVLQNYISYVIEEDPYFVSSTSEAKFLLKVLLADTSVSHTKEIQSLRDFLSTFGQ